MRKACLQCGNEFKVKPSHYDLKSYCSRTCMAEHYRVRMTGDANPNYRAVPPRKCIQCNRGFISYHSHVKCCSVACSEIQRSKRQSRRAVQLKFKFKKVYRCVRCNEQAPAKKELCLRCSESRKPRLTQCAYCHQSVSTYAVRPKVYCGRECYGRAQSIRQQGRKSHLWRGGKTDALRLLRNSASYGEWRSAVFHRDDFTCQLCFQRGGKLSAHHVQEVAKYPERILDRSNGITLCWPCHTSIRHREEFYAPMFEAVVLCHEALRAAGGVVEVVRSLDDVIKTLERI